MLFLENGGIFKNIFSIVSPKNSGKILNLPFVYTSFSKSFQMSFLVDEVCSKLSDLVYITDPNGLIKYLLKACVP